MGIVWGASLTLNILPALLVAGSRALEPSSCASFRATSQWVSSKAIDDRGKKGAQKKGMDRSREEGVK